MAPDAAQHVAAILNAAWMVRHYARGRRSGLHREQRAEAIRVLGLICRKAFNECPDFEAVLAAIVEGLVPRDEPRF